VPGAQLSSPGERGRVQATVPANETGALRVFVTAAPAQDAEKSLPAHFLIRGQAGAFEAKSTFITGAEDKE
jgi:hypothetical protein